MKTLFHIYFFISLFFSICIFYLGPSIQGNIYFGIYDLEVKSTDIYDCGRYTDLISDEKDDTRKNFFKKERSKCRRHKAMKGLEYTLFGLHFIIGVIFGILSLFISSHSFRYEDDLKKEIKYITFFFSIIGAILTIIYIGYSCYIFDKDSPSFIDFKNLIEMSSEIQEKKNIPLEQIKYAYPINGIIKTNKNGAFAKFNPEMNKYELLYPPKEDKNIYDSFAKYKELYMKQYNFNKELYIKKNFDIYFKYCEYDDIPSIVYGNVQKKIFNNVNGISIECEYLYYYKYGESSYNYDLYSSWAFTIFISIIIFLSQLGITVFIIIKSISFANNLVPVI